MANNIDNNTLNAILNKLTELTQKIEKIENKIAPDIDFVKPEHKKKYAIILKIINTILTNNKKDNIKNLLEFVKIDRDCFMIDANNKIVDDNEKEIFEAGFDKKKLNWYTRSRTKCYILTFLKTACNDIDYEFISKDITEKNETDGKYYRHTAYDIIKINK